MVCGSCALDNPEGMKFCGGCGTALARRCGSCGAELPPAFKFCGQCGSAVAAPARPATPEPARTAPPPKPAPPAEDVAERRQLTVMFCDLANFTVLSDLLDPEELREVTRGYQTAAEEIIERFGGHIAQYLGDGLLVYFGYPQAHEDDAQRAVRAAIRITKAVDGLGGRYALQGHRLTARVGIHTGLVVTGEIGGGQRREHLAMGKTPNIAARLESLADPGAVVISDDTRRLVDKFFQLSPCGAHQLKGIAEPVEVYRVEGEREADGSFSVTGSAPKSLVGRDRTLGQLLDLWSRAKDGQGQVVVLVGEAGIGKSQLLQAFLDQVAPEPHLRLGGRCQSLYENSYLSPIIDLLRQALQLRRDETPQQQFRKLELYLREHVVQVAEVAPLFADLLELPLGEGYALPEGTPQRRRQLTMEAMLGLLQGMSARQPVLLVLEDLHWVDPSTLELLGMLVDQVPTLPILILLTCRPTFTHPWGTRAHVTQLSLARLSAAEVTLLVRAVTGDRNLPPEVLEQIIRKADGVPLFVEELVKTIIEQGLVSERDGRYVLTGPLTALSIPATIQDSLTARLDMLTAGKEIAQLAAILGREFSYHLLQGVSPLEEGSLQDGLGRLVGAELLYQRGLRLQSTYIFKHAMIQETAAGSLLNSQRQQLHRRVAEAIAKDFVEIAESQPERLAHHFTEAGMGTEAVNWWFKAAQRAKDRSAIKEAIAHATRGMDLLATLEQTPATLGVELGLQMVLGSCHSATRGYGAPEVEQAFQRARTLCSLMGEAPQLFPVLWGLWSFYLVRADFARAPGVAAELMRLADKTGDPRLQIEARFCVGITHYFQGQPESALEHLDVALALDDATRTAPLEFTFLSTQDAGVCALVYAAMTLWMLGRPDEGLERSRQAVELARRISHQFSLAYALNFSAWLRYMVNDPAEARAIAGEAVRISTENGFFWVTLGSVTAGWATARLGEAQPGLDQATGGFDIYLSFGCLLSQTLQLSIIAELRAGTGDTAGGLARVDQALTAATETQELFWHAELHRMRGVLLLQQDAKAFDAAERAFRTALEIAGAQGARLPRLRAALALARLADAGARDLGAIALLADALAGLDANSTNPDLTEARARLAATSRA